MVESCAELWLNWQLGSAISFMDSVDLVDSVESVDLVDWVDLMDFMDEGGSLEIVLHAW